MVEKMKKFAPTLSIIINTLRHEESKTIEFVFVIGTYILTPSFFVAMALNSVN